MNDNELMHYGVLGMRWGVRRSEAQLAASRKSSKKKSNDAHDDYKKAHDKKKVKSMSDAELRDRNKRLQMEKQYKDLTKKTSTGKKIVNAYVSIAGTAVAVTGAYKTYKAMADKGKPIVNKGLDKFGDVLLKNLKIEGA